MATTYEEFEKAAQNAGLLSQFSQYDLDLAQKYPEFGQSILTLKQNYANATTDEQRQQINTQANDLRSQYGNYTGGTDGSQYISTGLLPNQIDNTLEQIGSYTPFSYDAAAPTYSEPYAEQQQALLDSIMNRGSFSFDTPEPTYTNQYADQQQALLNAILNREDFSWSKETDPNWSAYKKEYLREGDRATANALAQASAASGGIPSSYALTAASQAGDYYATQLSDMIPTLVQMAYEKYLNEYQMKLQDLGAVNTQEQLDYSKYLNDLAQYNTNRNFAYNQYLGDFNMDIQALGAVNSLDQTALAKFQTALDQYNADRDFAYGQYLDNYDMLQTYLKNLQGQETTEYNRAWDEEARAYERAQAQQAEFQAQVNAILGVGGTPSADLISGSGYSNDYVQAYIDEWKRQEAEKQQAEFQAQVDAILGVGGSPSADLINGSGYSNEYVQAFVDANAREQGLTAQSALAEYGNAFLQQGIMPSAEMLAAMGITAADAQKYIASIQAEQAASASSGGSSSGSSSGNSGTEDIYSQLLAAGATDYGTAYAMLLSKGYGVTAADNLAAYYEEVYYPAKAGGSSSSGSSSSGSSSGSGTGYNDAYFAAAMRSISGALASGDQNGAQAAINQIWDRLSDTQKASVTKLIANYGGTMK